jgi:Na+-driven multidrug efflux pump
LFAISILAFPIGFLGSAVLQSQKAQKQLYQGTITSSMVQIILLLIFIYFYGILGAILAKIVSRFFSLLLSLWLIEKALQ